VKERQKTVLSIQALRAIAALLVAFAHTYPELLSFGPTTFPNFFLGAIGVDLFFVISGFIMIYASEPLFRRLASAPYFFARRIVRIVPLYWIASTVMLFLLVLHERGGPIPDLPLHSIVRSYLFMPANRPQTGYFPMLSAGWTLYYEMFFYVVFAFAIVLPRLWAVVAVTGVFGFFVYGIRMWDPLLFEFCFGMVIALAYRAQVRLPVWLCAAMIAAAIPLWIWNGLENFVTLDRWQGWGTSAALVVAACALSRFSAPAELMRWPNRLGDASYSLYLFHGLVSIALGKIVRTLGIDPQPHPWLYAAVLMAACIVAALVIYDRTERPITRSLNRAIDQCTGRSTSRYAASTGVVATAAGGPDRSSS
jgi:exopolysaccharide production protein ExoZ